MNRELSVKQCQQPDCRTLRAALDEAVGLLSDARIALTFYSNWMACHGTPCVKTICDCSAQPSNPHYPSGRRIEESSRAFLARIDGKGGK